MEKEHPFVLGPVTFNIRDRWLDSVEFPPIAISKLRGSPEENAEWKVSVREALAKSPDHADLNNLAKPIYSAIRRCPSVLTITVKGYEKTLSRKVAEIVCKSALDAVSLLFGGNEFFHQQILDNERVQPFGSDSILENGRLLVAPWL